MRRNKGFVKIVGIVVFVVSIIATAFYAFRYLPLLNKSDAASCSIPTTVNTTVEVTPTGADNVIDCSGQSITVTSTGTIIVHSYFTSNSSSSDDGGAEILVGTLTVDSGGKITADGEGYTAGSTDGVGNATASAGVAGGSGGGHGGAGGIGNTAGGGGDIVGSSGSTFGDPNSPVSVGGAGGLSGGNGAGGAGGGAIKIVASGTVTINGDVTANGDDGAKSGDGQTAGGGGAGGSIFIYSDVLAGTGTVSADGGSTDQTATYYGGGGGGGRVSLVCTTSTSFSGSATAGYGVGSQNGGDGTVIGPGACIPPVPTVLRVFEKNASSGLVDREILVDENTSKTALTFASDLDGLDLRLQVEVKEVGQAFDGGITGSQITGTSNKTCTGLPGGTGVNIGTYCGYVEVVTGFNVSTQYKWRARTINSANIYSSWVEFGGNGTDDPDFTVVGAPTQIVLVAGDNQTGTVGQNVPVKLEAKVVDAVGYGVPFYSGMGWAVLTGGGAYSNQTTTTDVYGVIEADWQLGTVSGVDNNTIKVSKASPALEYTFTASAAAGAINHYVVAAGTTLSLTNTDFTINVTAKDEYNNTVDTNASINLYPVSSYDFSEPGLGVLTPVSTNLSSGVAVITTAQYTYTESINIKVDDDTTPAVGYSNAVLFVSSVGTCPAVYIDINQTWNAIDVPSGIFDCRGYGTFTVASGVTLTTAGYDSGDTVYTNDYGVTILADAFDFRTSSIVSGDGLGYATGKGPGNDIHGGYGRNSSASPYGDVYEPVAFGSGGNYSYYGAPGKGGGALKLVSAGNGIFEGTISVNGNNATGNRGDGGAGGSIWIDVDDISGAGIMRANGGNGRGSPGGGGSGGRIAVYYNTNTDFNLDGAHLQSYGNTGSGGYSGPGTVYVENKSSDPSHGGTLIVHNNGNAGLSAGAPHGDYSFTTIKVTNYGHVEFMDSGGSSQVEGDHSSLEVPNGGTFVGDSTKPEIKVSGLLNYTGVGLLTLDGVSLGVNGKLSGVDDVKVGNTLASGLTFYAKTWYHNNLVPFDIGDVTVTDLGTITMKGYTGGATDAENIGVYVNMDSLSVSGSGVVTADSNGYGPSGGPTDAVYGGYGSGSGSSPYGDVYEPVSLGSGGNYSYYGTPGAGGGAFKIVVAGEAAINGTLSANGAAGSGNRYDGGAAGSIWLDTGTLSGSGVIRANGGNGGGSYTGGGSGGRIAVYYGTNTDFVLDGAHIQAYGGTAAYGYSGAGTVYIEHKGIDTSKEGTLLVDNNNHNALKAGVPHGDYVFKEIKVSRYGHVEFMDNGGSSQVEGDHSSLEISSGSGMVGDSTKPEIKISGVLNYTGGSLLTLDGISLGLNGKVSGISDVTIGSSLSSGVDLYAKTWYHSNIVPYQFGVVTVTGLGTITMHSYVSGATDADNFGVFAEMTGLNVETGGAITASGQGYGAYDGPTDSVYGGYAYNSSDEPYGDVYEPVNVGSGGGYQYYGTPGVGGGAYKITVTGTADIDGTLSANGLAGSGNKYNGGAAGSIWLDVGTLSGSGTIQTNGGDGAWDPGNGGSGGRIAVYYSTNSGFDLSGASIQAYGGNGSYGYAGPGTVYLEHKGVDQGYEGTLLVDNNNHNNLKAGVPDGDYKFTQISAKRYGHVEFMDDGGASSDELDHSSLEIVSGSGVVGDSTKPEVKVSGVLNYTGGTLLTIDGVSLGLNGKVVGINDITVGATLSSGVTIYAKTWYHNDTVPYVLGDLTVSDLGTITLVGYTGGGSDSYNHGVYLEATGLDVSSGGVITADGMGYGANAGPTAAVHGGYAYNSSDTPYGNIYEPTRLGSGGNYQYAGTAGLGGGAFKFIVTGTANIDGEVTADGLEGSGNKYNGGAGGSIWMDVGTLSGSGVISANGGDGAWDPGSGGSGGRIALYFNTNTGFVIDGTTVQSYGGNGAFGYSGPGTVYIEDRGLHDSGRGDLLVDNNNHNSLMAGVVHGDYEFSKVNATRYGHVEFMDDGGISTDPADHSSLTIGSGSGLVGDGSKPEIKVSGVLTYTGQGALTIDGVSLGANGKIEGVQDINVGSTVSSGLTLYAKTWHHNNTNPYSFGDVVVSGLGTITMESYTGGTSFDDNYGVYLNSDNLTVEAGGLITSNSNGYSAGEGPGFSSADSRAGGSHGGYGSDNVAKADGTYGDIYFPISLGSGGNWPAYGAAAPGGGGMILDVLGATTINGTVSSNGGAAGSSSNGGGGGSGGSVYLITNSIDGTGFIKANGGNGSGGGWAGAGGRIAVYYNSSSFNFDNSHVQAFSGTGSLTSGPGTVYYEDMSVDRAGGGSLVIDNNNLGGRGSDFEAGLYTFANVSIDSDVELNIYGDAQGNGVAFDLTGDFEMEAGSTILGDGEGYPSNTGPGKGGTGIGYAGGGGGAHGGDGGDGQDDGVNPEAKGGSKYGDQLEPFALGSGGGISSVGNEGGAGGGAFAILATGVTDGEGNRIKGDITMSGTITVDGLDGKTGSPGGGGGAGGSILIHGNTCTIDGDLSAEGGEGGNSDSDGGSGGGGRISVLYNVGPCDITGNVDYGHGVPSDPGNYSAFVGQIGTFPPEPNSVPWEPDYQGQFEIDETEASLTDTQSAVKQVDSVRKVLGITESAIPVGGVINGTTVSLKANVYDAGARPVSPKRLRIQTELKKTGESYDETTGLNSSEVYTFSGGEAVVLSVQVSDLEFGQSYKWRVRVVNADNGLASEWREFGGNDSDAADFTITTVAELDMVLDDSEMDISETTSITLTAKDENGAVDPSYRGTVVFYADTEEVTLPNDYTFTEADAGVHTFSSSVKFFETGDFEITAIDDINPVLTDTESITITGGEATFVVIGANETEVGSGSTVLITWDSSGLTDLVIDNGIGEVDSQGNIIVSITETTTFTITGVDEDGNEYSSSITIYVSKDAPVVTYTEPRDDEGEGFRSRDPGTKDEDLCPVVNKFEIKPLLARPGTLSTLSWDVSNTDKVSIDVIGSGLPVTGSASLRFVDNVKISLHAVNGTCAITETINSNIFVVYPWEATTVAFLLLLAMEPFVSSGKSILYALLAILDRKKNKKPWGVVYDSVTKKPLSRAVVRLYEAGSGKLIDTAVSDDIGIFKLTPDAGEYTLTIQRPGYNFPSKIVKGKKDGSYENVYTGDGTIKIPKKGEVVMISIPMDPEKKDQMKAFMRRAINVLEQVAKVVSPVVFIIALLYSIYATILYPVMFNFVILGLYIFMFMYKLYSYIFDRKIYGILSDENDNPLPGIEVGLYETDFNRNAAKTVTNDKGEYNFVVKKDNYNFRVMDSRYELLGEDVTSLGVFVAPDEQDDVVMLVAIDFRAKLKEKVPQKKVEKKKNK